MAAAISFYSIWRWRAMYGVALDEKFNMQAHARDVELDQVDGCLRATHNGRPVHVVHYCGSGRGKHPALRDRLLRAGVPRPAKQCALSDVILH